MKLCRQSIENAALWEGAGFSLPKFDLDRAAAATREQPRWLHFGAGNIFRAFHAALAQTLLEEGCCPTGIIAAEGYDPEILSRCFDPCDNLGVAVTLCGDGSVKKAVVASVTEALNATPGTPDWLRLREIFAAPSLQLATFTITEKGYSLLGRDGKLSAAVQADFEAGPGAPSSYMGRVVSLLYARFLAGAQPIALVSTDNCSHNGDKLRDAVVGFVAEWTARGLVAPGFAAYANDPNHVSFPWSMIDKITPRPDPDVERLLSAAGLEDTAPIVTARDTYTALFVNAERPQYLIIEDLFPNGRPPLERAGVSFTDRETVDKVERMKVGTCLNPLHTSLAIFGCLLGYRRICDEMRDADLRRLVERMGYREAMPVVVDPGILNPMDFIGEVLNERLPNPFMPDTPQRIATDTSQKLSVRFGGAIRAYLQRGLDLSALRLIPLTLAGWCRYLLAVDDEGKSFELSPDPLLPSLRPYLTDVQLGERRSFHAELSPILSNPLIFGLDLYEAGLGERVEAMFAELAAATGAVRRTLQKYLAMEERA